MDAQETNDLNQIKPVEQENVTENPVAVTEATGKKDEKQTREEIVKQLQELIEKPVDKVKDEVDLLKQNFYKLRKAEAVVVETPAENDPESQTVVTVEVVADPLEEQFKTLLNQFKEKKAAYLQEQDKIKEANLIRKNEILEKIRQFTEDSDNINKYYIEFQQLQQQFKEITNVPQAQVNDLWKSYQLQVERFYDLLKINKELRDYDFKKNLDQKITICEAAEKLAEEEGDIITLFKSLQQLHDEWRAVGPVAKEQREELWQRFKNASTVINKRHQTFFETLKEDEQKNEAAKAALCEEVEAVKTDDLKSFNAWEEKSKEIIALQAKWKTVGFASRKTNNQLFDRFRKACDLFFKQKSEYFKQVKDEMAHNLEQKKLLCEKAEALKDSQDWKTTTDQLITIQKEWKTIGPVAKKYSDQIWKRFIAACDYYFEQKEKMTSSQKSEEVTNLKQKKAIIATLQAIDENTPDQEAQAQVRELMAQWGKTGHVPFKEKDKIHKEYQAALDKLFSRLNMHENTRRLNTYSSAIQQMTTSGQAPSKLYREREKLMRTFEHMKSELQTYENNMGFLTLSSKNAGSLVKEMERKVEKLKEDIQVIAQKIEMIDNNL